jgi:hypothetical protein
MKPATPHPIDDTTTHPSEGNKKRKPRDKTDKVKEHKRRDLTSQKILRNRPTTNKIGPRGMQDGITTSDTHIDQTTV